MSVTSAFPETYIDPVYHFSLNYPAVLSVTSFANPSGGGEVILLEATSTTPATEQGFQITLTPFSQSGVTDVTEDVIRQEVSNIAVINPQEVTVGGIGKGISFFDGTSTAALLQVWFVAGANLYQVTSPEGFSTTTRSILETWKFISS
jgi:hypothetical protein